jgi:glucosamine-6-phosphate deaminase
MNQNITEEEMKNYQELVDIGNEENKPDQDKLNKLLAHNKGGLSKYLKKVKIGKWTISIVVPLIIIFIIIYILVKNIFGYSAKFKLIKVKKKRDISQAAGDIIIEMLQKKSNPKISLSSGPLPKGVYKYLIDKYEDREISFQNTTFFSLDEFCGLDPKSKRSNSYYIKDNLLEHIDIEEKNIHLINSLGENCEENVEKYNELLNQNDIDLTLLSIDNNVNLGFNEPGTAFESKTHIIQLSIKKKEEISELFDYNNIPLTGITQGIDNILRAKTVLVVASGKEKAEGLKNLIKGKSDKDIPLSALKNHQGVVYVVADEDACSLI